MARVLLLETRHEERHRHHRAEYFPFLLGFALEQSWDAKWWTLTIPRTHIHSGTRYIVDVPEDELALLVRELKAWSPDVVVFNDRPTDQFREHLLRAIPHLHIADLTTPLRSPDKNIRRDPNCPLNLRVTVTETMSLFPNLDRSSAAEDGNEHLLDVVQPRFERRLLGQAGKWDDELVEPPLRLAVESCCHYRRPVRRNRFYRGLDSDVVRRHVGCSFCPRARRLDDSIRLSHVELAMRQIEGHQRAANYRPGLRFEYLFEDSPLSAKLDVFLEAVLERDLKPSTFITMARVDRLLAWKNNFAAILPGLRDAGHRLGLLSIGAENFSEEENERFNKGISVEQIWKCYEMLRELEAQYPKTFECLDCGYFATILFTPWTRPEDLRVNLEAARRLGSAFLHRALGTRLQLWKDAAITELARHDGLVVDREGSASDIGAVCISNPDVREVPWRFRDLRTYAIYRLLIRLDPMPEQVSIPEDDPLTLELREECKRLPRKLANDRVGLAMAIVNAIEVLGAHAGVGEVFRHCRES